MWHDSWKYLVNFLYKIDKNVFLLFVNEKGIRNNLGLWIDYQSNSESNFFYERNNYNDKEQFTTKTLLIENSTFSE